MVLGDIKDKEETDYINASYIDVSIIALFMNLKYICLKSLNITFVHNRICGFPKGVNIQK